MIDISRLSNYYGIRVLESSDVDEVLKLCQQNTVFYKYTDARPTREQILADMKATPPGIDVAAKYYVGFFANREFIAVMDLIDGYLDRDTAYIGFFMMNINYQGKQTGTAIIDEATDYLRSIGKKSVQLAIDKGNPQSTHFWKKNGFDMIKEVDVNGWTKLVAEKSLKEG